MATRGCVCLALAAAAAQAFQQPEQGGCSSGYLQLVDGDPRMGRTDWACCSECPGGTNACYEECSCMCYEKGSSSDIIVVIGTSAGSNEKCVTVAGQHEGLKCDDGAGNDGNRARTRIQSDVHTFQITTPKTNQVCARRIDAGASGWTQLRLVLKCYKPVCSYTSIGNNKRCGKAMEIQRFPGPEGKTVDECFQACCSHPDCKFFASWPGEGQAGLGGENDCRIYNSSCEQEDLLAGYHNALYSVSWTHASDQEDGSGSGAVVGVVMGIVSAIVCGGFAMFAVKRFSEHRIRLRSAAQAVPVRPKGAAVAPQQFPPRPLVASTAEENAESIPVAVAVPINPTEASGGEPLVCANCENRLVADARFCNHCGAAMHQEDAPPTEPDI